MILRVLVVMCALCSACDEPATEEAGSESPNTAQGAPEAPGVRLLLPTNVPVAPQDAPRQRADALVDLSSDEGAALVRGVWRYHDAEVVAIDSRAAGPEGQATGAPNRTHDIVPHAGVADFDDSAWPTIAASSLEQRRGTGRVSFGWYRFSMVLPESVGEFAVSGATLTFEITVDDYAEVWVNGELEYGLSQSGGTVARGFNAPNRVVLTRDAQPGQEYEIAVFGINGPISVSPTNFIWVRSAALELVREAPTGETWEGIVQVHREAPGLDAIVPEDLLVERVAAGFQFAEGPVWIDDALFFSDPNENDIYRLGESGRLTLFRVKSGYRGVDIGRYHQPGSNGLALDNEGRLVICEHGNRRVTRLEPHGNLTVLADSYEGKRLNSPNDVTIRRSDGSVYFTDPPFGLPQAFDDPAKELPHQGVYRIDADGTLSLLSTELLAPNGLAFSPDEDFLYVNTWEVDRKVVLRFPVAEDGTLGEFTVFFDLTERTAGDEIALDGLKVDQGGNVYVAGPTGIWIVSSEGETLGILELAELPANFAFGGEDGRTLYITARTGIYRTRLSVPGAGSQ